MIELRFQRPARFHCPKSEQLSTTQEDETGSNHLDQGIESICYISRWTIALSHVLEILVPQFLRVPEEVLYPRISGPGKIEMGYRTSESKIE
jgi:hypothetical protein